MQYSNNMVIQNMFLLLMFSLVHFQDAAEISDIIATEGQNVTLACAHSPPKQGTFYSTFWYKGKMKVFTIKPNGKFSISSHRKHPIYVGGNYSMILSQVDRYDHGTYSCKSVYLVPGKPPSTTVMVSKTVMVSLYVKARPIISSTSPSVQNMTQSLDARDLSLVCSVSAYPEAEAIWRKVDGQLPVNRKTQYVNGTLVLKEATKVDSGTYVCVASNELGTDSKNFTVTVFEPPQIIGNRRFHVNAGETASLICLSRGNPNPTFTWTWNDAENNTVSLSEGEESSPYSVTTTHTNTSSHSTLEIKKSNKELWKNYTCKVENVLGTDSAVISLQGKTRPESPHVVSVDTTDTQAEVTWEFGDNGGLELTSLTLQYKESSKSQWVSIQLKPPDGAKYTIVDLKPNTSYNFRILATNSLGTSPPSLMFQAKTSKSESNISAQSDEQDKGLTGNMTALIAGVAGGFLAVIIAIVGVFCFVRKIHKNSTPGNTPVNSRPTSQQEQTEMSVLLPHQIPNIPQPLQPDAGLGATANPLSNSRWEFPRDRLHLQTVLGSGAFGLVMKAQAQGIKGCVGKMFVAVKIVKESDSETARKDLAAELDLLKLIDPHPNVIGLLGCCTRTAPMMVIVEFCSFGDLQSYLRHCRGVEDKYYQDLYKVPIEKLGSRDLLSFAIQTARGMAHLAGMKVVHRDLAARNVLIDENKVCKVADFGFARDIYVEDHYTRKTQGGRFPIKWMAIESLLDGVSTTKSDVWSFGIVLWEIVTLGASPYPGMNSQEVINFLQDSYRMDKPKHCSEELYVLMLDCWQVAPQRRPTFLEMSRHLSKMISDDREYINMRMYEDHLYINFDKTTGTAPSASGTGTDADSAM